MTVRGTPVSHATTRTGPSAGTVIPMTGRPVTRISGITSTVATGRSSTSQITISARGPTTMRGTPISPATISTGPSQGTEIPMTSSPVTRINGSTSTAVTGISVLPEASTTGTTLSTLLSPTSETVTPTCKTGLDPNNSCVSYSCENNVQIVHKMECKITPECPESEKVWDEFHCCYSCPKKAKLCEPVPYNTTIKEESCEPALIDLRRCEGYCKGTAEYDVVLGGIKHTCTCCQEDEIEERQIELQCGTAQHIIKYIYIKSCVCK
ncbi:uncharacterized protein LOC109936912 [Rhincodon typus]|uniref:uncharacterized protein LOC109936912 n=1 Tax=Rhincodon typus TaxID=259920 RepID=UPI00202EC849|nr:uncharacterized protein LOC109936912 [Rhincodon typus]